MEPKGVCDFCRFGKRGENLPLVALHVRYGAVEICLERNYSQYRQGVGNGGAFPPERRNGGLYVEKQGRGVPVIEHEI